MSTPSPETSMQHLVRKFLKDSSVYSIGIAIGKLVSFLVLPVLTARLTPADFGTLKLLQVFSAVLAIFLNAGSQQAINRTYYDDNTEEHRRQVVGTGLLWRLILAAAILGVMAVASRPVSRLVLGNATSDSVLYVQFTLLNLAIISPQGVGYNVLRLRMQSVKNAIFSITGSVISLGMLALFLIILDRGIQGVLEAGILGNVILTLLLAPTILGAAKLSLRKDVLKGIISYGAPFLPHHLAGYLLFGADRYFLEYYATRNDVGIYSYAYSIAMIMTLVIEGASMAWTPYIFSIQERPDAKRLHATTARYVLATIVTLAVGVIVFADELVVFLASSNPEYWAASSVVSLLVGGYVLYGLYQVFGTAVNIPKKPQYLMVFSISGMIVNLGLNWLMVPTYGMTGAAVATIVSYFVMGFLAVVVTQRIHPIPYEWRRLALLAICGLAFVFVSQFIPPLPLAARVTVKLALVGSFPAILLVSGFFSKAEVRIALNGVRSLMRR